MKIILRQSVENLGGPGEIVRVKDGYARNYLIPQRLALPLTEGNLKQVEQDKRRLAVKEARNRESAEQLAASFAGIRLVFTKKSGVEGVLYGSVTTSEIAEALAEKGLEIDKRRLILSEPIKRVGEFVATVRLHPEVDLQIEIAVEPEGGIIPQVPDAEEGAEAEGAEAAAAEDVEESVGEPEAVAEAQQTEQEGEPEESGD